MRSMTGFASADGPAPAASAVGAGEAAGRNGAAEARWRWDARSVNGRGLEIRLRTPPAWETHETAWRAAATQRFKRGSISLTLNVAEGGVARPLKVNHAALDQLIREAVALRRRLEANGEPTAPLSIDALLAARGVLEAEAPAASTRPSEALADAVTEGLETALDRLAEARAEEGARLKALIGGQIDEIERLTAAADAQATARSDGARDRLRDRVAALLDAGAEIDENRLAQELAILAVKSDVREEIDRLRSHIAGARALTASDAPMGRKLDFLTQEFNREANTLCSKSQDAALTDIGLALKVVIDQLREQASNVE